MQQIGRASGVSACLPIFAAISWLTLPCHLPTCFADASEREKTPCTIRVSRSCCKSSSPSSFGCYLRQDNWLGVALAALMRVSKERRIALAGEAMQRLVHCPENPYRKTLLCECVSAYLPVDEDERRQFETLLRNHPDSGVQAMSMGLLDHVEERGKLQGVQEGQRELLRKQLETRFGPLSPAVQARLASWPADRLTEVGQALLSATSLQQLGLDS